GALGKEVWTLIAFAADWRWLIQREDSPWYPSMRLYRQRARGDWPGVIARVAGDLRRMAASHEIREWAREDRDQRSPAGPSAGDPRGVDIAFERAVALHQSGRLEDAVAQYRDVLGLDPTHVLAHNYLGLALQSLGRLGDALASYARALALKPDYVEAQGN